LLYVKHTPGWKPKSWLGWFVSLTSKHGPSKVHATAVYAGLVLVSLVDQHILIPRRHLTDAFDHTSTSNVLG